MGVVFYQLEQFKHLLAQAREACRVSKGAGNAELVPVWSIKPGDIQTDREWQSFCEAVSSRSELQAATPDVSWLFALWCWWAVLREAKCVPEMVARMESLEEVVVPLLIQHTDAWIEDICPQRECLNQLIFHLQTWYAMPGRNAQKFVQRFDDAISRIKSEPITMRSLHASITEFNQHCDKDLARSEMIAKRLQTSELGNIKAAHAEIFVNQFFNKTVANHPLPEDIAHFVEATLVPTLQYYLITEGEDSAEWSFWTNIVQLVVWALKPYKTTEEIQSFFQKAPALVTTLEEARAPNNCTLEQYQDFVARLSAAVVELLKGNELEYTTLKPRKISEEATITSRLHTTNTADEHRFTQGDWLQFFTENDGEIRCQFQMQAAGTDQLLFVNRYGQKVLQKSTQAMQACLDANIAIQIPNSSVFSASISAAVARLEHLRSVEVQRSALEKKAAKVLQEKQIQQELVKRQETEARKQAQIKAQNEARQLEQEQQAAQQQILQQQQDKQQQQLQSQAEKLVDALTLGTWAYISFEPGNTVRCKLAVRLASTGRHVFVDRMGSKVAELNRDQLIAMYTEGNATFQEPEKDFESRLESIVRGLRKTD